MRAWRHSLIHPQQRMSNYCWAFLMRKSETKGGLGKPLDNTASMRNTITYTVKQIAHFLTSKRATSVLDIRSYRGANWKSGHQFTHLESALPKSSRLKNSWAMLRCRRIHDINHTDVHGFWEELKGSIKEVTEKVVGYTSRPTRNDWFDDDAECHSAQRMKPTDNITKESQKKARTESIKNRWTTST